MTISGLGHTGSFTKQRSKMPTVSNLDVAVSSFWQLARHCNQEVSLHMHLSAVLGHPYQPHFPHPPSHHSPPHPSFPPAPKKKSPSQLRRKERRQYEASSKSQNAVSKESASNDIGGRKAGETTTSSADTGNDLPDL